MKVLSLFDGMSCGQLALNRLGIKVDTYYASEIDKYAMQVTQENFPETIQVGDVCNLDPNDFKDVDLMLAGSPCQGFSFAGKQLAFNDPRSALFFEFIRLLKEIKPKYFLLENVKMKKEYLQVISEQVSACYPEIPFGIEPIFINSSLVSAQNRQRYYWTNIPNITQPEERGIVLRDILETEPNDPTLMSDNFVYRQIKNKKDRCLVTEDKEKASSLSAMEYVKNGRQGDYLACDNDGVPVGKELGEGHKQDLQKEILPSFDENLKKMTTKDEKAYCLTTRYSAAYPPNSLEKKQRTMIPVEEGQELPEDISLVYDNKGKSHKPIRVGMNVEQVKVRKHEVDIKALQNLLRQSKADAKKTNKLIAEETNLPITKVEHWFRTDKSFAIPSDDIWFKLKEVLSISDDTFDKQIMEFEYRDGVYESTQRVYGDHGKSPTLTASNADQLIETTTSANGITNIKKGTSGKSWFFEQQTYSKDSKKTRSLKAGSGSGNIPKVLETKPKQVGTAVDDIMLVDDTSDLPDKSTVIKSNYYKSSKANFENDTSKGGKFSATGIKQKPIHIGTAVDVNGHDILKRVYSPDGKSPTLNTCGGGNTHAKVVAGAWRGRSLDANGKNVKWKETKPKQMLETRKDEKSNAVSTFTKDNLVVQSYREVRTEEAKKARKENRQKTGKDHTPFRAKELQPRDDGKVGTVTPALNNDHRISLTRDNTQEVYWRKLTPLECERLQTVPDNYTNHVSNTQRYKMLGNGWTIEVITHILKNMEL